MVTSLLTPSGSSARSRPSTSFVRSPAHSSTPHLASVTVPLLQYQSKNLKLTEKAGFFPLHDRQVAQSTSGTSGGFETFGDPSSSGSDWESDDAGRGITGRTWEGHSLDSGIGGLILAPSRGLLQPLSQETAMGIVLRAVGTGTGWTTGSGLEGPSDSKERGSSEGDAERPTPIRSKSPRRRMGVAFTCNVCGHRTTRAINPHAYTDGTVFVQCGGCNVFHKLVDNLNLFHELKGRIFEGYNNPGFGHHQSYDFLTIDDFPLT